MDMFASVPEWLVWCALGGAGAVALASIGNLIETALGLEVR